ncbi:unnamed protein product [Camellia sinensis]
MWLPKESPWAPSLSYSIFVSVLLLVTPLLVFSLVGCTLGPQRSWFSFHSPWPWRVGFFSSYSLPVNEELDGPPNLEGSFILNSSLAHILNSSLAHTLLAEETALQSLKEEQSSTTSPASAKSFPGQIKRYTRLKRQEAALAKARSSIREAASQNNNMKSNHTDPDCVPKGLSPESYLEMEKLFKIHVYEEGEPPMFHNGLCRSKYSTEGRFIMEMEKGNFYRTKDPDQAFVFFLPFSVVMMVQYLYVPGALEYHAIGRAVVDYIDIVAQRHPFWNRSLGADHFMLSCHDWGATHILRTTPIQQLYQSSLQCQHFRRIQSIQRRGPSPSHRPILAFFAGRLHGHIRHLLLNHWKEKYRDIQVYDNLPDGVSYESIPRVVEAIYAECIPVLISKGYVPPFSDVLNWKAFSISVAVKDIPNTKKILMGISQNQYLRLHRRVKQVQRHFVINGPPKRLDIFHMVIHSVWLQRLNVHIQD